MPTCARLCSGASGPAVQLFSPWRAATLIWLAILTSLVVPSSTSAATAVRFGPDFNLSSLTDTNDPPIREVSLAASPSDASIMVAGFIEDLPRAQDVNCRSVFSVDAGRTWSSGGLTPLVLKKSNCFDPSVAADPAGVFYYGYLNLPRSFSTGESAILVARSTDGGRSFATSSVVVLPDPSLELVDKPYIAVDAQPASPLRGTVYVSYTSILPTASAIRVRASRDAGATWSSAATVSRVAPFPAGEVQGSLPVVAPDGSLYVFYADYALPSGPLSIEFAKSSDGGSTWTPPADVAAGLPSPGQFRLKNADPAFGTDPFIGVIAESFPIAAIAGNGTIFVAWTDFPNGSCVNTGQSRPPCTNADVRLSVSKNGGKSWTVPIKVSDDTGVADQFLPWIAVDPGGLLSLGWLDRRLDPGNLNYDVFYTNTTDGRTFLPNVKVNSSTSIVQTQYTVGDYTGLAATSAGVVLAWPDLRVPLSPEVFAAQGVLGP